ncbi:hypothetical protein [Enemella dayhoffiae]|nr:hypothetical protein [Enemella dayhoffiae]
MNDPPQQQHDVEKDQSPAPRRKRDYRLAIAITGQLIHILLAVLMDLD